jgi:hypothetical protein
LPSELNSLLFDRIDVPLSVQAAQRRVPAHAVRTIGFAVRTVLRSSRGKTCARGPTPLQAIASIACGIAGTTAIARS